MDDGAAGLHREFTLSDRWLVPSLQVPFALKLLYLRVLQPCCQEVLLAMWWLWLSSDGQ